MHISWLGTTAVRIQTKNLDDDVNIVIDPYKPELGQFPRSLSTNILLYTKGDKNSITISGDPFVLLNPGECDIKGVLVTAVEGNEPKSVMFRIDSEQMTIGHLGLTNKALTNSQKELLSDVDILLIPIGHEKGYDSDMAVKIVNELEPRIIIPMAFKSENDPKSDGADKFLKAMGAQNGHEPEKKVIIKKKDLPQEDTQIIILNKE